MGDNVRIIADNVIDTATITSSPAAATNAPISNLQNGLRAYVARMTTAASPWVILSTWATDQIVSGICLYKHNFTADAIIRIYLYSNTAATVLLHDSGEMSLGYATSWGVEEWGVFTWGGLEIVDWPATYFTHWLDAIHSTVRAVKVVVSDAGNTDGYLELGRIYTGAYFSPAVNISYGAEMGWKEQSRQFRTDGNSLRTEGYEPYRYFNIDLSVLTVIESTTLLNNIRKIGLRKDFLFSGAPNHSGDGMSDEVERNWTSAVKLISMPGIKSSSFEIDSTSLQLEEV